MSENRNELSSMDQRIDSIRVRESDRRIAKAYMHDADVVADLVGRAVELVRGEFHLRRRLASEKGRGNAPAIDQASNK